METKTKAVVPAPVLTLHQKLHKAKQSIGKVAKNATNPHFKKSYSDINAITEAVEPISIREWSTIITAYSRQFSMYSDYLYRF
jgi:hypothetical protein